MLFKLEEIILELLWENGKKKNFFKLIKINKFISLNFMKLLKLLKNKIFLKNKLFSLLVIV
jgi:hypothetical protein